MKNDKLFHLQGLKFCLVFLVAVLCYTQRIKGDLFQENIFHLFLKAIGGMLALSFWAEKPCTKINFEQPFNGLISVFKRNYIKP